MSQPSNHSLQRLAARLAALVLIGSATIVHSQTTTPAPASPAAAPAASLPLVAAEVRKVDLSAGKITLKHGEIPNLEMPPMTMVFVVEDKALLDQLKPGDRVKFTADKRLGSYMVLTLQRDE
ncbi:copper-binding protein [Hydrogenophaga sp. ZJX-1]|uniref:copper-binding protein n=1 Tax=Hydrogenophaga sp. ZJX-1 TaxID=3404778 RepID=UPI003B28AD10